MLRTGKKAMIKQKIPMIAKTNVFPNAIKNILKTNESDPRNCRLAASFSKIFSTIKAKNGPPTMMIQT